MCSHLATITKKVNEKTMEPRNIFMLIVLSGVLIVFSSLILPEPKINDSTEYIQLSKNLLHNNLHYAGATNADKDFRLFSKRTLGFPLFIAFQKTTTALFVAQLLLYLLLVMLGFKVLNFLSTKQTSAWFYLLFVLFSPLILFHVVFILSDLMLAVVVLIAAVIGLEKNVKPKHKLNLIFTLWAVALLIKPVILPSIFLIPLVVLFIKHRLRIWSFASILPFMVWFMVSAENYYNTGVYEYSSISTINLAHYNAKLTIASKYGNDSAQQFTESKIYSIPTNSATYREYLNNLNAAAKNAILQNIPTYIKVQLLGMVKMVIDPGRWELYTYFKQNTADGSLTELLFARKWNELNSKMQANQALFYTFLFLLTTNLLKIIGIIFSFFKPNKYWFMLLAICAYFTVITGPIGAARFMLPAAILSIVLSVYGWTVALDFFQKRSKR